MPASPSQRLPTVLLLAVAILSAVQAYRSVYWLVFYADHNRPLLAAANYVTVATCGSIAFGIFTNVFRSADRPSSAVGKFFDMGSGLWPTAFGLVVLGAGVYGLLVVANYVDDNYNWIFYAAEGGLGLLILKRTFTMKD